MRNIELNGGSVDQHIRLFVSSTFLDMQAERNALARTCFPVARRLFANAGVSFTEIDLRWGLPENSPETVIAKLCLEEVVRCRGYFIGILGGRYGCVHASVDTVLSMTELEIRKGAFDAPASSFIRFYFKLGAVDDGPALSALKSKIRERFSVSDYASPEGLSAMILADLAALAGSLPVAPDKAYGSLLRQTVAGVARTQPMAELDAFIAGEQQVLRLLGPSGSGKSILLASWFHQRQGTPVGEHRGFWQRIWDGLKNWRASRSRRPSLWLIHCAGELTVAGGLSFMLDKLGGDMRAAVGDVQPAANLALKEQLLAFHRLLGRVAAAHQGVVLIIDDVDALHLDPILPFHWLPPDIRNVKWVLSGRSSGVAEQLDVGARTLELPDFNADERDAALIKYLDQFGKTLPPQASRCMIDAGAMARPLALRLVADELRLAETPGHMVTELGALVNKRDVKAVFAHVLERLECEHGRAVISAVCGLLACSRGGLWESELRALLRERTPLPAAQWSAVALAFSRSVVDHEGRYALHFDELHNAVQQRYLPDRSMVLANRQQLIAWLLGERAQAPRPSRRVLDELPWQLCQVGDWNGLHALMLDAGFFMACWEADPSVATYWWRLVESNCGVTAPVAWDLALGRSTPAPSLHATLGLLFAQLGHVTAAAECAGRLADRADCQKNDPLMIANLLNLSGFLMESGRPTAAAGMLDLAATLLPQTTQGPLCASYRNARGNLRMRNGETVAAAQDYLEAERLHRRCRNNLAAAQCRHNRALAMMAAGDHSNARRLLESCAETFRAVHDIESLAKALINLAASLEKSGKLKRAMASVRKAELLARARRDDALLCNALNTLARIQELSGDRDGAEGTWRECGGIFHRNANPQGNIDTLLARAVLRMNLGTVGRDSAMRILADAAVLAARDGSDAQRKKIASIEESLNHRH